MHLNAFVHLWLEGGWMSRLLVQPGPSLWLNRAATRSQKQVRGGGRTFANSIRQHLHGEVS